MKLKHFPDKPWEQDPKYLAEWDRSGKYACQQKIDGWRTVIVFREDGVIFISRHDKPLTDEIEADIKREAELMRKVFPVGTQLDGEWLSRRSCSKEYRLTPKMFILDVMRHGETWLLQKPYRERIAIAKNAFATLVSTNTIKHVAMPLTAEPGKFEAFYEEQKTIPFSEGVVIKGLDSKIIGDRKDCAKNPLWFKVKYRAGADGEQRLDHLRR